MIKITGDFSQLLEAVEACRPQEPKFHMEIGSNFLALAENDTTEQTFWDLVESFYNQDVTVSIQVDDPFVTLIIDEC